MAGWQTMNGVHVRKYGMAALRKADGSRLGRMTVAAHGIVHFVGARGRVQTYLLCDDEPVRRRVPDDHYVGVPTCLWCWQAAL